MQDLQNIVGRYLETFNEADATRRRELLEALYTEDSTYTDPHADLHGPAQIDAFIEQTQARFPGFTFKLSGPIDAHHSQARFQWQAGAADVPAQHIGFDVIVADDSRIRSVYGFTDAAPAA